MTWRASSILTPRALQRGKQLPPKNRWEFVGVIASDGIRKKYVGKSVAGYFAKGSQNPVKYVNCT